MPAIIKENQSHREKYTQIRREVNSIVSFRVFSFFTNGFQTSEWKTQIDNETNIAELIKFGETLGYSELEVVDEQYKHTAKEI